MEVLSSGGSLLGRHGCMAPVSKVSLRATIDVQHLVRR